MSEHRVNLSNKSDRELKDIVTAVLREQNLRRKLDASPERIDQVVRQYQVESGVKDGDPWEYPGSSLLRPMEGARRRHNGKLWRSTIDHNVWEPGVSGWVLEPETDPETGEIIYPPFVRPSGAHDAYKIGDRITGEDGNVYAANRDGVDWPPEVAPQDWDLVEPEPDPEPDPPEDEEPEPEPPEDEEPTDPEEPEPGDGDGDEDDEPTEPEEPEPEPEPEPDEPAPAEWVQPTGGHDAYNTGDRVTFEGSIYVSVMDGNVWNPTDYPAGWERQE